MFLTTYYTTPPKKPSINVLTTTALTRTDFGTPLLIPVIKPNLINEKVEVI